MVCGEFPSRTGPYTYIGSIFLFPEVMNSDPSPVPVAVPLGSTGKGGGKGSTAADAVSPPGPDLDPVAVPFGSTGSRSASPDPLPVPVAVPFGSTGNGKGEGKGGDCNVPADGTDATDDDATASSPCVPIGEWEDLVIDAAFIYWHNDNGKWYVTKRHSNGEWRGYGFAMRDEFKRFFSFTANEDEVDVEEFFDGMRPSSASTRALSRSRSW